MAVKNLRISSLNVILVKYIRLILLLSVIVKITCKWLRQRDLLFAFQPGKQSFFRHQLLCSWPEITFIFLQKIKSPSVLLSISNLKKKTSSESPSLFLFLDTIIYRSHSGSLSPIFHQWTVILAEVFTKTYDDRKFSVFAPRFMWYISDCWNLILPR